MQLTLGPTPWYSFTDENGQPYSGGLLYTYVAGTTTPATTYSNIGGTVANANPIVLDSAGRCGGVYLAASTYKYRLFTSAGVLVREQDNIPSTGLLTSTVGSILAELGGDPNSPITATSYPSGATFDKFAAGSAWVSLDSANLTGTFALEAMMVASAGTVTCELVNVTDASDTAIVSIAGSSATGDRQRSSAITFAASGTSKVYGIKVKVNTGYGMVWAANFVRLT